MTGETVYLGLGSNLGDREFFLCSALEMIQKLPGCEWIRRSSFYETAAWGKIDQPDFLNLVVEVRTVLEPRVMLNRLHVIEYRLGRERRGRWESRIVDIDILLFGQRIIHEEGLTVPHPRLAERRFVLIPLVELDAHLQVPDYDTSVETLLQRCPDAGSVRLYHHQECHAEVPR